MHFVFNLYAQVIGCENQSQKSLISQRQNSLNKYSFFFKTKSIFTALIIIRF